MNITMNIIRLIGSLAVSLIPVLIVVKIAKGKAPQCTWDARKTEDKLIAWVVWLILSLVAPVAIHMDALSPFNLARFALEMWSVYQVSLAVYRRRALKKERQP